MRKLALCVLIVALGGCQVYQTRGPANPTRVKDLTPVCYEGRTLRLERDEQVRKHLANGATLGQCPRPEDDSSGSSS